MKGIRIMPSPLNGEVSIPPSKSISHRAIICAGLAEGISNIGNIVFSDDITATLKGMEAFGIEIVNISEDYIHGNSKITINGSEKLNIFSRTINCKESGSTLRFLIPISGFSGKTVTFTGKGKLVERPLDAYYKIFDEQNIKYNNTNGKLPLTVEGLLKPDIFEVEGDISSQFITGLMFVLPLLNGDSRIVVTSELESKGYVDLTIDVLKKFSILIENNAYKDFYIKGNQKYKNIAYVVEGDFSQAAFWVVAGLLNGGIKCSNINIDSLQGDKAILDVAKAMGGKLKLYDGNIEISKSFTKGTTIDASQYPDLVPILAVLGSLSSGTTKITNAKRLRIKESDRLNAITTELNKLGADIMELEDGLVITGKEQLSGGTVDSWNDHRIAMALAIASTRCTSPVYLTNYDSVKKSYPTFWDDFKMLGGKFDEWNLGE